ncbi:MAG: type I phosphomannose isomerase catalytic subunit [Longicatena sp.]
MQILKPLAFPTIWGGTRLLPFVENYQENNIGQLYTASSVKGKSNEIINGEYKGKTFYDYYQKVKDKYGYIYDEYPLLIALVDAKENLSVQVHPSDFYAKCLENLPFGKIESWYFLEEPDSKSITNGSKCKNKQELIDKVSKREFENIIDTLAVKKDDYVFVEAGTLHALNAGSMVYEIQENSDLTYRFYDYNRKDSEGNFRELHLEKAKQVVDVSLKSKAKSFLGNEITEKKYVTKRVESNKYQNMSNNIEIITIFSGTSLLMDCFVQKGMSIVLEPQEKIDFDEVISAGVVRYII